MNVPDSISKIIDAINRPVCPYSITKVNQKTGNPEEITVIPVQTQSYVITYQ